MTQRIMLRGRKYLCAVLIGPRAPEIVTPRRHIALLLLRQSRQNREIRLIVRDHENVE